MVNASRLLASLLLSIGLFAGPVVAQSLTAPDPAQFPNDNAPGNPGPNTRLEQSPKQKGRPVDDAAAARALAAYPKTLPACNNAGVLETIQIRFGQRETTYWDNVGFWDDLWDDADLVITGFRNVRKTADRPWGSKFIPRRFCTATASLSNGKSHQVAYSIIEDGGIIGFNYGVEWCMVGLDRQYRFAPGCRAARP
jgi:hypothetical protein